jgi:hypothetical protein
MPFIGSKVALKSPSGEFLTYESGSLKFSTYNAGGCSPEIMFHVPSALYDVTVQTYTREFVSVDASDNVVVVPCNYNLGLTETFTFICLEMNFVAIKAGNGKYVKLDTKTKTLSAVSTSIGQDETFEVIPVLR